MTHRSPYSGRSQRRAQRAAFLPKLLGALITVTLLVTGVLALFAAGFITLDDRGVRIGLSDGRGTPESNSGARSATPGGPVGTGTAGAAPPTQAANVGGPATATRVGAPASPVAPADGRNLRSVAQTYVDRWNAKDYNGMYDLIAKADQQNIARDKFTARYEGIAAEAGLAEIKATLGDATPGVASFPLRVEMQSSLVGSITEDNRLSLRQEGDEWRVAWTPSLIFKDLGDGLIRFNADVPARGRILDRKGRPLAQQGLVSQIGVVPGQIKDEKAFLDGLSAALGIPQDQIKAKYANAQPDWFVPLKILPEQLPQDLDAKLKALPGVAVRKSPNRVYPQGTIAAHVVGYVGEINAEELKTLAAKGYIEGDRIGRAGIEAWGEQYLAGKKGGQLTVLGTDGKVRTVIAERKSEPAADITLTIDLDLQRSLEEALGDRPANGVVMDPNTGGIVAMASHPTFDPNGFILGFDDAGWARLNDENIRPLWNRTSQYAYPSGSIFKVITATAALDRLGMTPQTVIPCPAQYSLPGSPNVWRDWTFPNAQGDMSLQTAITRSCNTVFYEIGKRLNESDPNYLAEFTRAFGLGKGTGLEELPEVAGTVPDPEWKRKVLNDGWATGDAINFSIGQGFFLSTPLQMANLYNAIANGGTLLRPFLAAKVTTPDNKVIRATDRKEIGKIPVSGTAMQMIRTGMKDVTSAGNGTATEAFKGSPVIVAGKTGTAEVPPQKDHGWFASFAPVDSSKITVLTMVENGGPGSQTAAPIARKVYDAWVGIGSP